MSRTVRRKNTAWKAVHFTEKLEDLKVVDGELHIWLEGGCWLKCWRRSEKNLTPEQFLAHRKAWYYGDTIDDLHAPAKFRYVMNRAYRAKANRDTQKAVHHGLDSVIVDRKFRDMNRYYF